MDQKKVIFLIDAGHSSFAKDRSCCLLAVPKGWRLGEVQVAQRDQRRRGGISAPMYPGRKGPLQCLPL